MMRRRTTPDLPIWSCAGRMTSEEDDGHDGFVSDDGDDGGGMVRVRW
jgi:hypothetical protein